MARIEDLTQDFLMWKIYLKAISLASLTVLVLAACASAINPTMVPKV